MADATRDAKLRLDLDTVKAVRGMDDVVRAGEKVERQLQKTEAAAEKATDAIAKGGGGAAGAASAVMERFGADNLSKTELRKARAEEKRREREMLSEVQREMAEEKRNREAIRSSRAILESGRRKLQETEEINAKNASATNAKKRSEYEEFSARFANEQEVLERQARRKATEDRLKRIQQTEQERKAHEERVAHAERETTANRLRGITAAANSDGNPLALLGMFGGAAGAAAAAIIPAVARSASRIGSSRDRLRNPDMGHALAFRETLDDATLGASGAIWGTADDWSGVTNDRRVAEIAFAERRATFQLDSRMARENRANLSAAVEATARAAAHGDAVAPPAARFDQGTIRGMEAHREEQSRIPFRDDLAAAQRESAAAGAHHQHELREQAIVRGTHDSAIAARQAAEADLEPARLSGNIDEHNAAIRRLIEATTQEREAQRQLEQQNARTRDSAIAGMQSEMAVRQQNIQGMRNELAIQQNRLQAHLAAAGRIGSMNPLDRRLNYEAVQQIRNFGYENTTPEVHQRAQQIAPEWFQQQAQRFGEDTWEMRNLREQGIVGAAGTDNAEQMRANSYRLGDEIRRESLDAARSMQQGFGQIMRDFTDAALAAMRAEVDLVMAEMKAMRQRAENGQFLQKAQNN